MFFLVFLFVTFLAKGQNQEKADSLKNELVSIEDDSAQLELLRLITVFETDPNIQIEFCLLLIEEAQKNNDAFYLQKSYISLGTAYRRKGDLENSLKYLFESANIAEKEGLNKSLGEVYGEISNTFLRRNNDVVNAIIYNNKAIKIFKKTGDRQQLGLILLNTGFNYYENNDYDSATSYYEQANNIFREIGLKIGIAYSIGNAALIKFKKGDLLNAEKDLLVAINMLEPLGDAYGKADFLNQLGSVYELQGKTDNAISTFEESLQISKKYDLKEQISDGLLQLSILYEVKRDYKESLNSIKEHFLVRDSISNAATVQKLSDLRTKFEVGQKQTEVDLLTAEKKTQQIISWAIAAFALTIIILAGIIYKYYKAKATINLTLQSQKYELERLNETKDKFFSIISHDLRGPISAFQGVGRMIKFAVKKDKKDYLLELSDDIDESAGRLSNLLDGLLSWALQQQGHFPNVPEKVLLKSIVDDLIGTFKNTAASKGIVLSATFDEPIELWVDRNTTETIIRNIIGNALKFTEDGGSVSLHTSIDDATAKIEVIDSGVGMAQEKVDRLFNLSENKSTYGTSGEKGLGLGLQLVYEFIEMNNGSIEVQSEEGEGTRFVIRLPLFDQVSEKEPKKLTSFSRSEIE